MALRDDAARTWNVTDETVAEHGIQAIINCTEEGDIISFKTTRVVKPPSRIVIPRRLTIEGPADRSMDGQTATFTCPDGDGLFLLR